MTLPFRWCGPADPVSPGPVPGARAVAPLRQRAEADGPAPRVVGGSVASSESIRPGTADLLTGGAPG